MGAQRVRSQPLWRTNFAHAMPQNEQAKQLVRTMRQRARPGLDALVTTRWTRVPTLKMQRTVIRQNPRLHRPSNFLGTQPIARIGETWTTANRRRG